MWQEGGDRKEWGRKKVEEKYYVNIFMLSPDFDVQKNNKPMKIY
jgi:hypothetical protein